VIGRADRDVCVYIEGTSDNVTVIDGSSTEGQEGTINDQRPFRIFSINPRGRVLLYGVTLKRGHSHDIGGGAILNEGDLAIYNSLLTENSTHGRGGAIHNTGNLWILESTLSENWSRPNFTYYKDGKFMPDLDGDGKSDEIAGGAIANFGGSVLMYNVTISGNLGGFATKDICDKDGRGSEKGGGGGGILNVAGGVIGMNNSTVAHNRAKENYNGGGIYNDKISTANIWNTIVAENYSGKPLIDRSDNGCKVIKSLDRSDCKGIMGSFGYNIVGKQGLDCTVNLGPGDQVGGRFDTGEERDRLPIDPKLGDLSVAPYYNGGPTPTHALLDGSPAIDAGNPDPAGSGACAETDQRYLARPKDGPVQSVFDGSAVCDIGAYEYGAPELSVGDVKVTEGNSGEKNMTFEVRLSYPSVEHISVSYETADGSAKAGSDYYSESGNVLLNPSNVSAQIYVRILGDPSKEPNETLFFNISVATGLARIKDGQAVGTIKNDD
jgi:hypothetical protein